MTAFRVMIITIFLLISGYTAVVVADHGFSLFPVFFGDISKMAWPGQFNVDFMCFLALSASWVAWRHKFSAIGLLLAVPAFFGGALFLSVYLFVLSLKSGIDVRMILLGEHYTNE